MSPNLFRQSLRRFILNGVWGCGAWTLLTLNLGCRMSPNSSSIADSPSPVQSVPQATQSSPSSESTPSPQSTPSPESTVPQVAQSPSPPPIEPPTSSGQLLPDPMLRQWQPLSESLFAFGEMTVTPNEIRWSEVGATNYTVVSQTDQEYLLSLNQPLVLGGTAYSIVGLMLDSLEQGEGTPDVEVAFYKDENAMQQGSYSIWGVYFAD
ncbi:MAG TPA: hypothetical protein ACFE0H_06365 [Elainellaceae cyanobacterium]